MNVHSWSASALARRTDQCIDRWHSHSTNITPSTSDSESLPASSTTASFPGATGGAPLPFIDEPSLVGGGVSGAIVIGASVSDSVSDSPSSAVGAGVAWLDGAGVVCSAVGAGVGCAVGSRVGATEGAGVSGLVGAGVEGAEVGVGVEAGCWSPSLQLDAAEEAASANRLAAATAPSMPTSQRST